MNSTTNPNSFGGSFNYDGRTGLGIASLGGGPGKGIGSNWSMGDALSSPKGEFDYDESDYKNDIEKNNISISKIDLKRMSVRDLANLAGLIDYDKSNDDYDQNDAGIENKAHTSYHRGATDSLSQKGKDISSLGGLGNSIASVIGLSAGKEMNGNIISESCLKDFIKETILSEYGNNISGNVIVKSSGKSSMYKNMNSSTNTSDAPPKGHLPVNRHGIKQNGYGQKRIKIIIRGSSSDLEMNMTPTTDGAETVKNSSSQINFEDYDDGKTSTYDILNRTTNQNFVDNYNVLKKNNIYKWYTQ